MTVATSKISEDPPGRGRPRLWRKDRFRHRRYFDSFPARADEWWVLCAFLGSGFDFRTDGAFWDRLNKAIYRCAAVMGKPPSTVCAADLRGSGLLQTRSPRAPWCRRTASATNPPAADPGLP